MGEGAFGLFSTQLLRLTMFICIVCEEFTLPERFETEEAAWLHLTEGGYDEWLPCKVLSDAELPQECPF